MMVFWQACNASCRITASTLLFFSCMASCACQLSSASTTPDCTWPLHCYICPGDSGPHATLNSKHIPPSKHVPKIETYRPLCDGTKPNPLLIGIILCQILYAACIINAYMCMPYWDIDAEGRAMLEVRASTWPVKPSEAKHSMSLVGGSKWHVVWQNTLRGTVLGVFSSAVYSSIS